MAAMFAVPEASNTADSRFDDEATIDFKAGSMNVMEHGWTLDSFRPGTASDHIQGVRHVSQLGSRG